jgi:hypothetical protein
MEIQMKQKTGSPDRARDTSPRVPPRKQPAPLSLELRSVFRRRVDALVEKLSEQASDESLAAALEAPSDFGGLARLLSDSAALGVSLETVDPLAEAVARGAEIKQELLREAGGGWSSPRVAELLGITRQAVDKRRRAGKLLALQTGQGDHVYPVCQFADGEVLPGLDRFLAAFAGGGPWVRLSVLVASTYGEQGGPAGAEG